MVTCRRKRGGVDEQPVEIRVKRIAAGRSKKVIGRIVRKHRHRALRRSIGGAHIRKHICRRDCTHIRSERRTEPTDHNGVKCTQKARRGELGARNERD